MTNQPDFRKLLEATRGEVWRVSNKDPVRVVDGTGAYIAFCDPHHKGDPLQETRAALIVAAVNALPGHLARIAELEATIDSIYIYANDTLSGRVDGPDDREWQRAAVVEIRNRARRYATVESAVNARAALSGGKP